MRNLVLLGMIVILVGAAVLAALHAVNYWNREKRHEQEERWRKKPPSAVD